MNRPDKVIPELCHDFILSSIRKSFTHRDTILYALGVGVSINPTDLEDLRYTYENADGFAALPSYITVIPPIETIFDGLLSCPGMPEFNPALLLHGEEKIQLNRTVPTEATIECKTKIVDVLDKGKGALVLMCCEMFEIDLKTNQRINSQCSPLCLIDISIFIRGIGGFGGLREREEKKKSVSFSRSPDLIIKRPTNPSQAILYRLSGDTNPLHIDPDLAVIGGFDRPILHGLCVYGMAAHTLVKNVGGNDPSCLKSMDARFASPVFPGDELAINIWIEEANAIRFNVKNLTTNAVCVVDGYAVMNGSIHLKKTNNKSLL